MPGKLARLIFGQIRPKTRAKSDHDTCAKSSHNYGPNMAKHMGQIRPKTQAKSGHDIWAKSGQNHGPNQVTTTGQIRPNT